LVSEVGDDRVVEELEGRASLLSAGGQNGPDPLAPATAGLAARALGDLAVDHHEAEPLLHGVVRRLDPRGLHEAEVMLLTKGRAAWLPVEEKQPDKGEVYGYASWSPRKGILVLRNPSDGPARHRVDLESAFELPKGACRSFQLASPWKGEARPALTLNGGEPHTFELAPFEVVVLEAEPAEQ